MCRLVMGNKTLALQEMSQACALCQSHPKLLQSHKPQLHTLLGLYAMSMNCMEAAEAQFTAALKVIDALKLCQWSRFVFISCYTYALHQVYLNIANKSQLFNALVMP